MLHVEVSRKIKEEFENGRDYYKLDRQLLTMPENPLAFPSERNLSERYQMFRG